MCKICYTAIKKINKGAGRRGMNVSVNQYKESLLQWIWQELRFRCTGLKTECGKTLEIISQGKLNKGAGPDFLHAGLIIDGVEWHGCVEIHKNSEEWYTHGHHKDSHYNAVVLHVVYDTEGTIKAETQDGHTPFTLNLRKYIEDPLHRLMKLKHLPDLPCSASEDLINQPAFERQIEKVHQEYFEYKVEEVLSLYPEGYGISRAWKSSFVTHCYMTLGVSANVSPMKSLSKKLTQNDSFPEKEEHFIDWVYKTAFNSCPDGKNERGWVTSGIRPAAHPSIRVKQAAAIHYIIENSSLSDFMKGPGYFFNHLTGQIKKEELPGKMLLEFLYYLSVLPSFYLLGELVHSKKLKRESHTAWIKGRQPIPASIKKKYEQAGFTIKKEHHKLGIAHQYKRYCRIGECRSCEVFKNSIRA